MTRTASLSPGSVAPRCARWFTVAAAALALSGCASVRSSGDWPMVPSQRAPVPTAAPVVGGPAALPAPVLEDPNPPDLAAGPDHADLFERVRAGYRLPEVTHARVDQQVRFFASRPDYLNRVFERAERYLYYIVGELEARQMPLELAMLPVVESAYNPYAYSRARAAGLWQFIPPTAAHYQVRVNWWQDGRRDVIDSTRAALDYLQMLNTMFGGDWWLALAAYNCGEGCVSRAVARNRAAGLPTDYFSLRLPKETQAYVPKLIAMARVVGNPEAYELGFTPIPNEPYFARVEIGSQIDLRLAAQLAGVGEDELHALNPAFNRWATDPDGPHHLLVPFETAPHFADSVARLAAAERMPLERRRVEQGDTLAALAKARNVSPTALQTLNGLRTTKLTVGDELLLPASSVAPLRAGLIIEGESPESLRAGKRTRWHVVKRGETLSTIARRYGMRTADLARTNGMTTKSVLPTGARLKVQSGPHVQVAAKKPADTGARQASTRAGAAPGAATAASGDGRRVSYVVRRGDTLHRISRQFAVSVAQLREWNGLPGSEIRAGQRIVVYVDPRRDVGG